MDSARATADDTTNRCDPERGDAEAARVTKSANQIVAGGFPARGDATIAATQHTIAPSDAEHFA
jgi:hypothetical protein